MIPRAEDLDFFESEIENFVESLSGGTLAFPDWALNEESIHWRRMERRQRMFQFAVSTYFVVIVVMLLVLLRK